jgi:hypothetical protein
MAVPMLIREWVQGSYGVATEDDIGAFEAELGYRLPIDYRDFLLTRNGGRIIGPGIRCISKYPIHGSREVDVTADWFYGLNAVPSSVKFSASLLGAQSSYLWVSEADGHRRCISGITKRS